MQASHRSGIVGFVQRWAAGNHLIQQQTRSLDVLIDLVPAKLALSADRDLTGRPGFTPCHAERRPPQAQVTMAVELQGVHAEIAVRQTCIVQVGHAVQHFRHPLRQLGQSGAAPLLLQPLMERQAPARTLRHHKRPPTQAGHLHGWPHPRVFQPRRQPHAIQGSLHGGRIRKCCPRHEDHDLLPAVRVIGQPGHGPRTAPEQTLQPETAEASQRGRLCRRLLILKTCLRRGRTERNHPWTASARDGLHRGGQALTRDCIEPAGTAAQSNELRD